MAGLESSLRAACAALDPESIPLPEAPGLWASLAAIEKLAAGAKLRLARRVDECGRWRRDGYRSAEEWMARTAGTSVGAARASLGTSTRVKDQPDTDEALRHGELSESQANTVSDAADANPSAERELVRKARTSSSKQLREAAGHAKAQADPDPEATHRRQHAARSARMFTDAEGLWNLHLRHTPEVGAELRAILQPFLDLVFHRARTTGTRDSHDAYTADAVTDIFRTASGSSAESHAAASADHSHSAGTGDEPTSSRPASRSQRPDTKVVAFLDWEALVRGHTENGETCEIAGVGAVPVSTARALLGDATLTLVIRKGHDIRNVTHLGRQVTTAQRSALEARGYRCARPTCGATRLLQIDHVTGWAITHTTRVDDLEFLCAHDHNLKTHCGYWLSGPPGHRRWHHPDGTIEEPRPPPHPLPGAPPPQPPRPPPAPPESDDDHSTLFP